jgi:hypothetical protein
MQKGRIAMRPCKVYEPTPVNIIPRPFSVTYFFDDPLFLATTLLLLVLQR